MNYTFLSDLQIMRHMMSRMAEEFDRGLLGVHGWNRSGDTQDWTFTLPVANFWNDEALNLRVVMPAIDPKDFELVLTGDRLIVRGERKLPDGYNSSEGANFILPYGKFERVIDLPSGLKLDALKSEFQNGVLDIHIPIGAPAKAKRLHVVAEKVPDKREALKN